MPIELYDLVGADEKRSFSPFCWRVKMALAHKQLEIKTIPWHFTDKEAIAFSGQGKVPVIVDGENVVCDSWKIANYLENNYSDRPVLFGSLEAKSHALFIKNWSEKVLAKSLFPLLIKDVYFHLNEKDKIYFRQTREQFLGQTLEEFSSDRQKDLENFRQVLIPLRETLAMQSFLAGDRPNFADYIVFGYFQWARCISELKLLETNDPIYSWREKMLSVCDGMAAKAVGYEV